MEAPIQMNVNGGSTRQLTTQMIRSPGSGESGDRSTMGTDRARRPGGAASSWARGLGWFSIGLGAAELLVPSFVNRLVGVRDTQRSRRILRALGAREVAAGLALLLSRRSKPWLRSRVAGDVLDLALLGSAFTDRKLRGTRTSVALAAVAGVTAVDVWASLRRGGDQDDNDSAGGDSSVPVRAVVTIRRPAAEIYDLWRNFENLPRFMQHVRTVEVRDPLRSRWRVSVTGRDELAWDAVITDDRPNELIAWRSVEGADFAHAGEVRFVPAPGGRGTEVHLRMNVFPPAGKLGGSVGKLVRRLPEQVILADLKRLKQLLEMGEIMKSDASIHRGTHPARPEWPKRPAQPQGEETRAPRQRTLSGSLLTSTTVGKTDMGRTQS